jgi:hypothetical protein
MEEGGIQEGELGIRTAPMKVGYRRQTDLNTQGHEGKSNQGRTRRQSTWKVSVNLDCDCGFAAVVVVVVVGEGKKDATCSFLPDAQLS